MRYRGWTMSAALEKLQKITALDPTYNDVGQKIELVKSQQSLDAKFTEAQQYLEQDKWSEAIQALEALQAQSPDFRTEDIKQALFLAHFRQGVDLMAKAGDAPDLMSQAIQSFDRALTILPGDKTAEAERQLANLYRQGYLFVSRRISTSVIVLQQVSAAVRHMEAKHFYVVTRYCTRRPVLCCGQFGGRHWSSIAACWRFKM